MQKEIQRQEELVCLERERLKEIQRQEERAHLKHE
jgi:hypothetical protein